MVKIECFYSVCTADILQIQPLIPKILKVRRQTNRCMDGGHVLTFNQLSSALLPLKCLVRNCLKTSVGKWLVSCWATWNITERRSSKGFRVQCFQSTFVMQPSSDSNSDTEGGLFSSARHVSWCSTVLKHNRPSQPSHYSPSVHSGATFHYCQAPFLGLYT